MQLCSLLPNNPRDILLGVKCLFPPTLFTLYCLLIVQWTLVNLVLISSSRRYWAWSDKNQQRTDVITNTFDDKPDISCQIPYLEGLYLGNHLNKHLLNNLIITCLEYRNITIIEHFRLWSSPLMWGRGGGLRNWKEN